MRANIFFNHNYETESFYSFYNSIDVNSIHYYHCYHYSYFLYSCVFGTAKGDAGEGLSVKYRPAPRLSCILLFPFFTSQSLHGVLHFSHDWFSYHVGSLRWPRSDLKVIKHQTFCKTQRPPCLWRSCNAVLGNYNNNSAVV